MQPLLVSPQEIRGIVTMAEAVEAVRLGFREWGENPQLNAPRRRIHIPTGVRVSVHQGGVPAANATGLMAHCEWVKPMAEEQVYPRLNHPVIVLYDSAEGELKGIIVGDYSLADITFIPLYTRRERYGIVIDDKYPNLKRWGEDLIARPQVVPTI